MYQLSLKNFEQIIDPRIVDRGFEYYQQDSIQELLQTERGEFVATVLGTEEYSVGIKMNEKQEILESYCDCPYDYGPYCKHVVAVLFYLKDSEDYLNGRLGQGKFDTLVTELKQYKQEELIQLISQLAKRNSAFRRALMGYLEVD